MADHNKTYILFKKEKKMKCNFEVGRRGYRVEASIRIGRISFDSGKVKEDARFRTTVILKSFAKQRSCKEKYSY